MKKIFVTPQVEICMIGLEDVLTLSVGNSKTFTEHDQQIINVGDFEW